MLRFSALFGTQPPQQNVFLLRPILKIFVAAAFPIKSAASQQQYGNIECSGDRHFRGIIKMFKYSESIISTIANVFSEKKSTYGDNINPKEAQDPIINASPEVREIIERVLQAERDKLYMKNPRNINDDILKIIKDVVK
ncbi:MAG: hypothetical protein ACRC78_17195 [Planktothrix sp.]